MLYGRMFSCSLLEAVGRNLRYCTDACLRRFLEARNWNVEKAKKILEETLARRSTYKPEEIHWVVKYFLDTQTFHKVKFVYPKNKDSVELMKTHFDVENLPTEFGGKTTLNYDHEEFSTLMAEDGVKSTKLWWFDGKQKPTHLGAEVVPEPETLASAAS